MSRSTWSAPKCLLTPVKRMAASAAVMHASELPLTTTRTSPALTGCARLHPDLADRPRHAGLQLVLHLHGLDDDQGVAGRDRVTGRHRDVGDPAGHGSPHRVAALARRPRRPACG